MRVVACIFAALFALLFVALIGRCVVLPRVAAEDIVRTRLSEATRSTIGREIEFTGLEFELFPPSVIAVDAVVGDAAMPLARAERIRLTPALAPLLVGVFLVDSAIAEGAEIHLVRTRRKIGVADAESDSTHRVSDAHRAARSDLAVRGLSVSGATITLEDRSVDPPLLWTLRGVDASAFADALGSPVRFDLAGEFSPSGRLVGTGEVAAGGKLQLAFEFDAVTIATARPYFAADSEVGGLLTGSLRVEGSVDNPAIELTATLREANLQLGEIALRGTLGVTVGIRDVLDAPSGLVELDATEAELGYANFFTKAPGTPARVVGQVTTNAEGLLAIDAWNFVMQDLDGHVRAGNRDRFQLADRWPKSGGSAREPPRDPTNAQLGGIHLKDGFHEDDIPACEGSHRLDPLCG